MDNVNNKLSFDDFSQKAKEKLQQIYPECQVETSAVMKNNGRQYTGITIKSEETNIAPQIYLESFYEAYLDAQPLESIVCQIQETYEEHRNTRNLDVNSVLDFDAAKTKICYKLVNADRNRELLQQMPHRLFQDLAVVYYLPVSIREEYDSSLTIRHELMECWHVTEETLYECARENTAKLFAPYTESLSAMMRKMGHEERRPAIPLYVARYSSNTGGAAVMLCKDILQDFADTHDDFYILPSSVHEVLLLPVYTTDPERGGLNEIVREVNGTTVLPEDQLSDHVYYYHADTGILEICE